MRDARFVRDNILEVRAVSKNGGKIWRGRGAHVRLDIGVEAFADAVRDELKFCKQPMVVQ